MHKYYKIHALQLIVIKPKKIMKTNQNNALLSKKSEKLEKLSNLKMNSVNGGLQQWICPNRNLGGICPDTGLKCLQFCFRLPETN